MATANRKKVAPLVGDETPAPYPNVSLRVPLELKETIYEIARQEQRTASAQILFFVRHGIENYRQEQGGGA